MPTILFKAIRYSIFDICLDILFSKLHNTFNQREILEVRDLTVGMHLSMIKYKSLMSCVDCKILALNYEANFYVKDRKFCLVTFSFNRRKSVFGYSDTNILSKFIPLDYPTGWEFIK